MAKTSLDVLAVAPHPDDAELFCGGTLAMLAARNYRVGILDLTLGELSSQGSVSIRKKEAAASAKILHLTTRLNAKFADGKISADNEQQIDAVVHLLRQLCPTLLLVPYWEERHPDHSAASSLLKKAVFMAALPKYKGKLGTAHTVLRTLYYPMRVQAQPSFIVDVSSSYAHKLKAIATYASQFKRASKSKTLVSSPHSISSITARDEYFGAAIGVKYGEPFITRELIGISDPLAFFNGQRDQQPLFFTR